MNPQNACPMLSEEQQEIVRSWGYLVMGGMIFQCACYLVVLGGILYSWLVQPVLPRSIMLILFLGMLVGRISLRIASYQTCRITGSPLPQGVRFWFSYLSAPIGILIAMVYLWNWMPN